QVSPQNPFRLLAHVGEECAGAIQFIPSESLPAWLSDAPPQGVDWLSDAEFEDRMDRLVADRSEARCHGDEGQFSLPGAQAKTGLYLDTENQRWGIPKGATPTTHILKPNVGEFKDFEINEHFCLKLGARLGLRTAESWTDTIGKHRVIVVKRYDRLPVNGRLLRVHQEDFCQAIGVKPEDKYQKDGGPSANDILKLLRDYSSAPQEDTLTFLRALIYNYLIAGTDGHAKNYGMLISGQGQFRLTPLYDVISILPYKHQPRKLKLAMKVGGEYLLWKIDQERWQKAAKKWGFTEDFVIEQIQRMASALPEAAQTAREEVAQLMGADTRILDRLTIEISQRARTCLAEMSV
ncbi:MAG: HipA domain-containing protein, partial [Opitutales bacterium]